MDRHEAANIILGHKNWTGMTIAYTVDGEGRMEGPKAAAWGPFNPEYFIQPNGQRLA